MTYHRYSVCTVSGKRDLSDYNFRHNASGVGQVKKKDGINDKGTIHANINPLELVHLCISVTNCHKVNRNKSGNAK